LIGFVEKSSEDFPMKLTIMALGSALLLGAMPAFALGGGTPSGRESTTGDPAASSATPGTSPTTGNSMKPGSEGQRYIDIRRPG
jgi:hypothetical protein